MRRWGFAMVLVVVACFWGSVAVAADELTDMPQEQVFLMLENQERQVHRAEPLVMEERLNAIARIRLQEVKVRFTHDRPDGRRCFTAFKDAGISYGAAGENILRQKSAGPQEALRLWMESPRHYYNIHRKRFHRTGIACAVGADGRTYWVQEFLQ